jgi:hypothetical protein
MRLILLEGRDARDIAIGHCPMGLRDYLNDMENVESNAVYNGKDR